MEFKLIWNILAWWGILHYVSGPGGRKPLERSCRTQAFWAVYAVLHFCLQQKHTINN